MIDRTKPSRPNRLPDSQQVSFAVAEPRGPLAGTLAGVIPADLCDSIDGPQAGQVILLKLDPPGAKHAHGCLDVVDFPAHLRVRAGLHPARDEDRKLAGHADITESALALFDRLEPEFLRVECSRAI